MFISIDKDGNFEIDYTQDDSDDEKPATESSELTKVKTESKPPAETPFDKHPIEVVCLDSDDDEDDDEDTQPPSRQTSDNITANNINQQEQIQQLEQQFQQNRQQLQQLQENNLNTLVFHPPPSPPRISSPPTFPMLQPQLQLPEPVEQRSSPISLLSPLPMQPLQPQQILPQQRQSPQDRIGISALVNPEKTNSESPNLQNRADEFTSSWYDSQIPSVSTQQGNVQDNYYPYNGNRTSISPTSFSSISREKLSYNNRRRYEETGRANINQNNTTKMSTGRGNQDIIVISSSSESDSDSEFESSYSSQGSSSSEYEGRSSRMSRPPKKVFIKERAKRMNRSINIDSDSSSTSDYNSSDSEPEYVKSSCREGNDEDKVSKTETAILPPNEPSLNITNPEPKGNETSATATNVMQISTVNPSVPQKNNERNTTESVPIKKGFETMNVRGKIIPKPIVLVPSKTQSIAGRSASERQIPAPPQTEGLIKRFSTDTSPLIAPESLPQFKSQQGQPIQQNKQIQPLQVQEREEEEQQIRQLLQPDQQQQAPQAPQLPSFQSLSGFAVEYQQSNKPIQQNLQDQIIPSNDVNLIIGTEEPILGSLANPPEKESVINQEPQPQQQPQQYHHQVYHSQYPYYCNNNPYFMK